jgi:hypothetical protein
MGHEPEISASRIVRAAIATAAVVFLALAIVVRSDPRLFAAAAAFGTLWWLWDIVEEHAIRPFGEWVVQTLIGGGVGMPPANTRPTLDDTIRLLESHLEHGASRQVEINAAIRLEEIYRTVKKDPERARAVLKRVRRRYPDSVELARLEGQGQEDD